MAGQVKLCFALLLVLHVSLVSCRHDYYQYFSKYVKGESPTESNPSSTTGISTSKSTDISMTGLLYSENVISPKGNSYTSSNNDSYERSPTKTVIQRSSYDDDMRTVLMIRWGLTVGGIVAVGLLVCCVALCCPCCCKGQERRGFIVNNNIPEQPRVNLMQPQIPQTVTVQHCPPETQTPQNYPPPYDTQPIQQQYQYPSTEHLLHQNPMQPMGQQLYQQPTIPQGYNNPNTVPPPYATKY